ncbi:MAG: hypothetical protein ACM33V_10835, partial [Chloroflexota bacterium]
MSIEPKQNTRTTKTSGIQVGIAWLAGSIGAYFLTSFFSNFYSSLFQFVFLSLLFQFVCGITVFLFIASQTEKRADPLAILTLVLAFTLSTAAAAISWQFPGLFQRNILFMDPSRLPIFVLFALISLGIFSLL